MSAATPSVSWIVFEFVPFFIFFLVLSIWSRQFDNVFEPNKQNFIRLNIILAVFVVLQIGVNILLCLVFDDYNTTQVAIIVVSVLIYAFYVAVFVINTVRYVRKKAKYKEL